MILRFSTSAVIEAEQHHQRHLEERDLAVFQTDRQNTSLVQPTGQDNCRIEQCERGSRCRQRRRCG